MDEKPELTLVLHDSNLDHAEKAKAKKSCPFVAKMQEFCDALDHDIDMILSL